MKRCVFCGTAVDDSNGIGRRDECLKCGQDLHCCLQCVFYDASYANDCREPQAEPVSEKERSNFCDYFEFGRDEQAAEVVKFHAKAKFEKIFRK